MSPGTMDTKLSFVGEIANLLHAAEGNPLTTCIQCGTCSGTCPLSLYMDFTPRRIIALVRTGRLPIGGRRITNIDELHRALSGSREGP